MSERKELERRSHQRAEEATKDTLAEGLSYAVPFAGVILKLGWQNLKDRRQKRVDDFFRRLLTGDGPLSEEECREALEREPLCSEGLVRLLDEEEDEKSWAYAALFKAFALDLIDRVDRVRFLRFTRDLLNAELNDMRSWQKWSRPNASGPHVVVRVRFATQSREWFLQPELMQEQTPHVVEVLSKWGFINRAFERMGQARLPGAGGTEIQSQGYPVPGRYRLQVHPSLALCLFIFDSIAHGNGLSIGKPIEVSVCEEGRVDAVDFRSERRLRLDGTTPAETYTSNETKAGPMPLPPHG